MGVIRELIRRYPVAAIVVVVAAAGFAGWTIYQSRQTPQPGAYAPPRTSVATPAKPPGATPVTPTGPAGQAGSAAPVTPTSPGAVTPPETTGVGRANPFQPLASPQGSSVAPSVGPIMPPVPPLPPAGPAGLGQRVAPGTPPAPAYRVVGFVWGDSALAILEDGQGSYVVGPGDTIKPGVMVVAIDVRRELVRLDRDGTPVELMLAGRQSP